ncbi:MAG: hypothetical protein ACR2RB_05035 [Gammaproteobacteria bacterium]
MTYTPRTKFAGIAGSVDAHYSEAFTNVTSLTLAHNLGKEPNITVVDDNGNEVEVDVDHDAAFMTATLTWIGAMSGVASAN